MAIGHGHYRGKMLYADYGHLGKLFVKKGDLVKRGQVIGLAAGTPDRFKSIEIFEPHLHFALFQMKDGFRIGERRNARLVLKRRDPTVIKTFYNPDDFWLDGKPQCFDSNKDYSNYQNFEFTHPVACGEYGRLLVKKLNNK